MHSLELSDTLQTGNNRPFLYPSPSWPDSGIGLLLRASEIAANQPESTLLSGVDLLLQAADLIESEPKLGFDKPEFGINLLLEASELIESCTYTRVTSNSQTAARSLSQDDAASPASVDVLSPVDTAITWLENHIANSGQDAGKHLSPEKTASPSTEGSSSDKSVTSSSRPEKYHRMKINGSKITKVTTTSGCTCLGQQKKASWKISRSETQKRHSDDRDCVSVWCAVKTKNNKKPGRTTQDKDTSTPKQGTSGQNPPHHLLSGRSSDITQQPPISRKRPVQVVIPTRSVNQTPVLPTSSKRPCLMSPRPVRSPVLGCHQTETRPHTNHQNRLTINGVWRKRLGLLDESQSPSSRLTTRVTSCGHRPIGVVVPWIRK